jgi:nitroimidazol reductase NimA-like FMN-containing flavoprotein (pyridoxamine 5'-phosphate oxidase superfamily)
MAALSPGEMEFIDPLPVARLATVDEQGAPHVVPICPVLDLDRIVFTSQAETAKVRNIDGDPRVAICWDEYLDDWDALRQVVAFGRASRVELGFEFDRDKTLLTEKFPQFLTQSVIEEGDLIFEVKVERVSSWGL